LFLIIRLYCFSGNKQARKWPELAETSTRYRTLPFNLRRGQNPSEFSFSPEEAGASKRALYWRRVRSFGRQKTAKRAVPGLLYYRLSFHTSSQQMITSGHMPQRRASSPHMGSVARSASVSSRRPSSSRRQNWVACGWECSFDIHMETRCGVFTPCRNC
jgi:hypothetical protein